MSMYLRLAAALCLVLLGAGGAWAQGGPTGSLEGRTSDQSQAPLPGVAVTARHLGTSESRTATTTADGFFRINALGVGRYQLTYQLSGFKTVTREVLVEAAVPRTVDAILEVGGLEETVTVSSEAAVLQTSTAAVARQISGRELVEVPSSTRNFTHLLTATPGASADLPPVSSNDTGSISPSVNGTRTTSNSVVYNGVDITSLLSNSGSLDEGLVPAPETLEEVKLQTSLYSASTGRSGGGNFQLVTRSGSNQLRGSVYSFGQHEDLNANDFFFDRAGLEKPKARRLESGFTLGGPLKRDSVFFYGSFQYTTAETGYVPTASSRALVPAAFGLIPGERTAANIVAAFRQLNPAFNLRPEQISPLALQLLNTRNPVTGAYLVPGASGPTIRTDPRVNIGGAFGTIGGDPLVELRQVVPSEFEQYQGSLRLDGRLSPSNRLSVSYFYGDFPSLDSFPDPSTLVSPFTLRRSNRGQVASLGDTHVFGTGAVNELRAGYFRLRNTRRLDDPFIADDLTSAAFGISNPALLFDDRDATRRLGHFVDRGITWSFGGPNDSFNTREQETWHVSDAITVNRGNHQISFGGEFKMHEVTTDLPEEQATEFEKIENWQHLLLGLTPEADTQFGLTQKSFRSRDVGLFLTDDWRVGRNLVLNLGVRWDWYGWPEERNGFLGNFHLGRVTHPDNPFNGIVVPANASNTGIASIDPAIAALPRTDSNHTLNGQDLNNFAPRVGFAWTPGDVSRFVVRGGYGIFYDRPSAAFMNTVFSNYPHLREIEITAPSRQVPIRSAFNSYLPASGPPPVTAFFPFQVVYSSTSRGYTLFDGTGLGRAVGNPAETLEFRAVDPDLDTPYYHHFNLGVQFELRKDLALEVRYNGSRGRSLLLSSSFNIPWDLNDPRTPQFVFDRITAAFRAGGGQPSAADPQGLGYGYGGNKNNGPNNAVIGSEIRAPYLGFNDREAVLLSSGGRSEYNALQLSLTRRWSRGFEFHAAYTLSKSMDYFSSDPGSTAGSGRPDEANTGFSVENDARDLEANWAPSDFDRRHRFSFSGIWTLPLGQGWLARDWQIGAYAQFQSGRPFSVYAFESGLISLVFQRLDFAPGANADTAAQQGAEPADRWFNPAAFVRANAAGNTPRNFLRGPSQKRVDLSLAKAFALGGDTRLELRGEVFNVFNWVNLAMPSNNVASVDFGTINNTVGGPRVAQLGLRLTF
jgi:hypothetical protein